MLEKLGSEISDPTLKKAGLTITIDRSDLSVIMMGQKSFAASIEDGTAQVEGNVDILSQLAATLVTFEIGFEILPGTAGPVQDEQVNPFSLDAHADIPE